MIHRTLPAALAPWAAPAPPEAVLAIQHSQVEYSVAPPGFDSRTPCRSTVYRLSPGNRNFTPPR